MRIKTLSLTDFRAFPGPAPTTFELDGKNLLVYRMGNNFAEVHIGKNQLKIHLRPIDFVDPKGMVDKIPDGYNWTMDRRVYLKTAADLDYVMGLIEQSYKNVI